MRILITKLGSIGDIVHTLPALAAIRSQMPKAEIVWIAEKRSAEILRGNPMIDELIEIDTRSLRGGKIMDDILPELRIRVRELREFSFDIAIDFQGLLKSGMIGKLSGAKERWGFSRRNLREPASRVFLTDVVKIPKQVNIVKKNLLLAAGALGIDVPDGNYQFPISTSASHLKEAADIAIETGGKFAVLNPAGGWPTKLWHAEKYGALADRLWDEFRLVSVVVSGPGEDGLADEVRSASSSGKIVFAKPSLKGFYELAKRADVYVGGDTGPTHLAIAAGAPVVGIFGPTEWWRNGSTNPDDICVERNDIDCRVDCHRRSCSKWICMDIEVETVLKAVETRLELAQAYA